MGVLGRRSAGGPAGEAGALLGVEALDRTGLLVTSEGAFVRIVHVSPVNPLTMSEDELAACGEAFGYACGRLRPGQSLQFYVEARPVVLDEVLAEARRYVRQVAGDVPADPEGADGIDLARWRLYAAMEESLVKHADEQAAVELDCYAVVPYLPDRRAAAGLMQLRLRRDATGTAPLRRSLKAHRRAVRESLHHTEVIRGELEAIDRTTRLLDGEEVAELLWGRFNPTLADRGRRARGAFGCEVAGELELRREVSEARHAARELRARIAESAVDFTGARVVEVDRDLEQVIYAATTADVTYFGWLLGAMQTRQPYTLSVYVHALDRLQERQRQKRSYRQIFALNRTSEAQGRVPDFDRVQKEEEKMTLLAQMAGAERTSIFNVSLYQSIRQRGPSPDREELSLAVDYVIEQIATATDIRVRRGEFRQRELWASTLPLARDIARRTRRYVTRNVGDTVPLIGTSCGSPEGIPIGFAEPGRTIERLNPYDPSHDNFTLLIDGKSGSGKTMIANVLLSRCIAFGARAFVLDRAGHYEMLTRLIPGARHLAIGGQGDGYAVNPWDVADAASVSLEKIAFLVSLHSLLVGSPDGGSLGVTALERNLLEGAIRAVYRRSAEQGFTPREAYLREELRARSELERKAGAEDVAATLRSLAERLESFCGEGSYAYLVDRETSVPAEAPLVVFDTQRVPEAMLKPVGFSLAEYVTNQIEARLSASLTGAGQEGALFAGRSVFLIDEAWHFVQNKATGEWANNLARRARHWGMLLIVISQQLSDFATEHGRALMRNSTMQISLRQAPEELAYVKDARQLSDAEIGIISRLKTLKGSYSQAYLINGVRGRGAISIRVGPSEYWMATSEPVNDAPHRERALKRNGDDAWAAIAELARGGTKAGHAPADDRKAR